MNSPQPLLPTRKFSTSRSLRSIQSISSLTRPLAVARLTGLIPGIPDKIISDFFLSERPRPELSPLLDILKHTDGFEAPVLCSTLLMRRIGWRMRVNNVHHIDNYNTFINQNPAELPALRKSLSMQISDFFNEAEIFMAIEKWVISTLFQDPSISEVNVLVENGDAGEMAYSIAMLLDYYKQENQKPHSIRVVAQNTEMQSLDRARKGLYPHLVTVDLSPMCLKRYFDTTPEGYRVNTQLKKSVFFESMKLEELHPQNTFDILIASPPDQTGSSTPIDQYRQQIKPGGFLIYKPSYHTEKLSAYFDVIEAKNGIYRKRGGANKKNGAKKNEEDSSLSAKKIELMVEQLESELNNTKTRLDMTMGAYESTHDELLDINNQLQSSMLALRLENDQVIAECNSLRNMQASIIDANKSLKQQNDELHRINNRLETITSLCGVGMLYLNPELCIDMFTADTGVLFGLTKVDIGRPFSHLESPFQVNLFESTKTVLRSRTPLEQERKSRDGTWYKITIAPHISDDNIVGIVCSFINVTESKRENEWDRFRANILNRLQDAVIVTNRSGHVTYVNKAAVDRFGLYHRKKTGFHVEELYESDWKSESAEQIALETLLETGDWSGELHHIYPDGKRKRVKVMVHLLEDDAGNEIGQLTVIRDSFQLDVHENDSLRRIIEDLAKRNESFQVEE